MKFFDNKDDIKEWLIDHSIENFEIHDDLTVSVQQEVIFYDIKIEYLPLQFRYVKEDFIVVNNELKSLKGIPYCIDGEFMCVNNPIKTLDYLANEIHGIIKLYNNTEIISYQSPLIKGDKFIYSTQQLPCNFISIEDGIYKIRLKDYLKWNRNTPINYTEVRCDCEYEINHQENDLYF